MTHWGKVVFISVMVLSPVSACSGGDGASSFAAGTERGPCRSDGTCDTGLVCLSNTCVNPNPDAGQTGTGSTSSAGGGANGAGGAMGNAGAAAGGQGGAACSGAHPNVSGPLRTCNPGSCYCTEPFDTCYPSTQVATCCTGAIDCGGDAGPGGIDCTGQHPIIGPPRTCASGYCLCSDSTVGVDACYPQGVAEACCPPSVTLQCVP